MNNLNHNQGKRPDQTQFSEFMATAFSMVLGALFLLGVILYCLSI